MDGVWLGIVDRSNEVIRTEEGVVKVRDVRKYGMEGEIWCLDKFDKVKGVPWEPIPGRQGIELKCRVNLPEDKTPVERPMQGEKEEVIPRRVRITREQVRMAGFTIGCPGCRAVN